MLVTGIRVEGLRTAPELSVTEPERMAFLADGPDGIAMLDALELAVAVCDPSRTAGILESMGIADDADQVEVIVEDHLAVQVSFDTGDAAQLVDPGMGRTLRIHVDLELDPPLFGNLREQALRDPRLVNALGDATMSLRVGWIWTKDLTTASLGLLGVAVGEVSFPTAGADRPTWLPELLHEIAGRIRRVHNEPADVIAARLHAAALSSDPEQRRRFAQVAGALGEPPFELGHLELAHLSGRIQACFSPRLLRARQLGPAAAEALRLTEAVWLDQPDVLLVERPGACQAVPADVEAWLETRTEGDRAVLEQVLVARGGHA